MTNEESIRILRSIKDELILIFDHDRKYALDLAISALEKQVSKKPEDLQPVKNAARYTFSESGKCPCCGETIDYYCNSWVCDFCGQAIDWGDNYNG